MVSKKTISGYEHIVLQDELSEDRHSISYYAYDTKKRKKCIVTFSKVPTSWEISIHY